MSIRYSYPIYFSALLLLLAACTKDELADGDRLPEGQYPLEIARITLGVEGGARRSPGAHRRRASARKRTATAASLTRTTSSPYR